MRERYKKSKVGYCCLKYKPKEPSRGLQQPEYCYYCSFGFLIIITIVDYTQSPLIQEYKHGDLCSETCVRIGRIPVEES